MSLLLVCGRPSVATINKSLIERGTDGVEVELVDSEPLARRALKDGSFDLVVGDAAAVRNFKAAREWDLSFSGVLSAYEVDRIRQMALREPAAARELS